MDDKSERQYCLRPAAEDKDAFDTVRSLPPVAYRAMRFCLHAALAVGSVTSSQWSTHASNLINKGYTNPKDLALHFTEHVQNDWKMLRAIVRRSEDDVAMLMHLAVLAVGADNAPKVNPTPAPPPAANAANPAPVAASARADVSVLGKIEDRTIWELEFSKLAMPHLDAKDLQPRLEASYKRFGEGKEDEGTIFIAELQERYELDGMDVKTRASTSPALWRFRREFSLEDFRMELKVNAENEKLYPILSLFLAEEERMRGLRYLPQIIEWQSLLYARYNRGLDKAAAAKLSVGDVLTSATDHARWTQAVGGCRDAWNQVWHFVDREGCLVIPALYKQMQMNDRAPITFSLPYEKDEGMCPLALARFLGERHNQVVHRVDEVLLMRGKDLQRANVRQPEISSKFFSPAHALTYDLLNGFAPFVEKQCVQYTATGQVMYDFKNAEIYLLDLFAGKPLIQLEVRMFQYSNAEAGSTYALRQKVKQEALSKEMMQSILKELTTTSRARACLELLETCVSFLQATGGAFVQVLDVGEKPLGEYVKNVLLLESAEFGSKIISEQVLLKHIDSLWKLLRDFCVTDPFAGVSPKYREKLDAASHDALVKSAEQFDRKLLLPLLKEFITSRLADEHYGKDKPIKEIVGFLEAGDVFLSDLTWFDHHFPKTLQMRHILDAYTILEAQH